MASTITATRYVSLANLQKGIGEKGGTDNRNKFTAWFGVRTAWCAIFTMWLADQLGDRKLIAPSASCSAQVREWKRRGRFLPATTRPKVGDLFYLTGKKTGFSHVGIVAHTYADGSFLSIEGNWGNRVQAVKRTRSNSSLAGFARPDYKAAAPVPVSAQPVGTGGKPAAHVVKKGETLSVIAAKFGVTVDQLVKMNKIKNKNVIFPGQVLRISPRTVSLSAVIKAAKTDPGRPQGGTTPGAADDVRLVEEALLREGLLSAKFAGDGSFGSMTVEAYSRWQRSPEGGNFTGSDADGIPGRTSLERLGRRRGFTVVA